MDRQNRRDTGALRSTGLLRHRHVHPPCPPNRGCGCDVYQPDWLTGQDRTMAVVTGCIDIPAGSAVSFSDGCATGDTVQLHGPGIYYAAYTLHMPPEAPAAFCLQLNGEVLPESRTALPGGGSGFAQAMFAVNRPADLQLIAAAPLSTAACGDVPLITLAVFRIG